MDIPPGAGPDRKTFISKHKIRMHIFSMIQLGQKAEQKISIRVGSEIKRFFLMK